MRIRWTPPAVADLQSISDYLKEHHPHYRQPTIRKLYDRIRSLKNTPHLGRPGRIEGTRELLFPPMPYIAVYPSTSRALKSGASSITRRNTDPDALLWLVEG
jgi:plasmid stabilization system protein ParE